MKTQYLIAAFLLLVVAELSAQNDTRLYNRWNSGNGMSWLFGDRRDDEVDRGTITYDMPPVPITDHCTCKTVVTVDFDWRSSSGKVAVYYHLNAARYTISLTTRNGTSEEEKKYANENCLVSAKKALTEFKANTKEEDEMAYSISGNTLYLGGKTWTAVYPVESLETEKKANFHSYDWKSGSHYEGEWKGDKMHGQGTHISYNGNKYVGQWKDHLKHGQGTYTWADGSTYTGEFMNDMPNGYGVYTTLEGDKYAGNWLNNEKSGNGTYTWADGSSYTGQWKDNDWHGQGTYISKTGEKSIGEFREGLYIK